MPKAGTVCAAPAAALASALPAGTLDELCGVVLGKLEGGGLKQEATRSYMQALGAIRWVSRLGGSCGGLKGGVRVGCSWARTWDGFC